MESAYIGQEWEREQEMNGSDRVLSLLRACCVGAAMALAWGILSHLSGIDRVFPNEAVDQMFSFPLPVQLLLYVVISPVAEEYLFRKFLFDLVCKVMRRKAAAVVVSVLFALWHGNVGQMLYAFPAGLILQEMRNRSQKMGEPVCCHIGANLTAILVTAFLPG